MIVYDTEAAADAVAREALLDRVMGQARFTKTSARFRDGRRPAAGLSLVARDGDAVVGTVRLWHAAVFGRGDVRPVLLLGPLAVDPSRRARGIGAGLMRLAIAKAAAAGHAAVILVGDPTYYERFGFSAAATGAMRLPGPFEQHRLLALELEPGALAGAAGLVLPTGAPAERVETVEAVFGTAPVADALRQAG
ncbi:GNAT family N-acetyltransferase [Prosthecodimorpha staleyi]|uniref:N-acetyltransferase n=1 Tax=Prosthecodimorpha staleyi TaxID=2840188 RepID=A0A947D8M4_9HYPH|nr:N-acetyltransferase [Prosthecodimorpha staleyi]MBT9293011.1 N-acetyltransferase [Prosthecodimorpha staleyi]